MEHIVSRFMDVLSSQKEIHKRLVDLSEQKQEIIEKNDVTALDAVVKQEQRELTSLTSLEKRRRQLMEELSQKVNKPAGTIVLGDFLTVSTPKQREKLEPLSHEISSLLSEQMRLNDINKRLVESRLDYVHFALDMLTDDNDPSQHYGAAQGVAAGPSQRKSSIIDQKI